jgi:signal transduction histidine kinase
MNHSQIKKGKSILVKIFSVFLALSVSIILFLLAFWGVMVNRFNPVGAHIHLAFTVVILIAVVFLVASYLIRKILKPLSLLNEAVRNVGQGNLDLSIPIKSNDEFGDLALAFNQMTTELKNMIQARENLLLDVSHELRTPITRAKIALEMMPESLEKDSLSGDLKEMETMITEILESERLINGAAKLNFESIKVESLLQMISENYKRENKRIVLFPVSAEMTLNVDVKMILTVLRNLIDNSIKYTPANNPPVEISVIKKTYEISIRIEDFGQGIPEDKLPFIFDPFYRVDQSRSRKTGGYGLGLHLCKRIMDSHGAKIQIINKPGGNGIISSLDFKTES